MITSVVLSLSSFICRDIFSIISFSRRFVNELIARTNDPKPEAERTFKSNTTLQQAVPLDPFLVHVLRGEWGLEFPVAMADRPPRGNFGQWEGNDIFVPSKKRPINGKPRPPEKVAAKPKKYLESIRAASSEPFEDGMARTEEVLGEGEKQRVDRPGRRWRWSRTPKGWRVCGGFRLSSFMVRPDDEPPI